MKKLSCFLLALGMSLNAHAWWEAGHMLVANIAFKYLNDSSKNEIARLLPLMKQENTDVHQYDYPQQNLNHGMMYVALWADHLYLKPNSNYTTFTWHFIDKPYSIDGTQEKHIVSEQNIVWALNTLSRALKQKQANKSLRARTLSYIIHYTGDIHQPLHNTSFYSKKLPNGDRGGNLYRIKYTEPDGSVLDNLHKLWDSALALYPSFGYSHEVSSVEDIQQISNKIIQDYPPEFFGKRIKNTDPQKWHEENYKLVSYAYNTPYAKTPSSTYIENNTKLAEQQIALAGYRLATLLNRLLN
jgi:hypothetical protein